MSLNKINHVFLFFLFLSFFGCKSESLNTNLKSNWEYLNLKGKVKTLKQIEYSGESKSSMIFQSTYFVFNKQGFNTSLEIGTNKESTLVETIYKNEKFVTKEVRQLPNKGGTSTTTFKYNERRRSRIENF